MSESFYKNVPPQLVAQTLGREGVGEVDPMLCGYQRLLDRLQIPRAGVIHLGGHLGQELPMYAGLGFRNVLMVEPLPREHGELAQRVEAFNATCGLVAELMGEAPARAHAFRCAISDRSEEATFYKTRMSSLSSLARPQRDSFSDLWKEIDRSQPWYRRPLAWWRSRTAVAYDRIPVRCKTLDELMGELPHGWRPSDFSYLRMNIQGAELRALRGAESTLQHLSLIDLETNLEERYEGVPDKRDFDAFLNPRGFVSVFGYRIGPLGNLIYLRQSPAMVQAGGNHVQEQGAR